MCGPARLGARLQWWRCNDAGAWQSTVWQCADFSRSAIITITITSTIASGLTLRVAQPHLRQLRKPSPEASIFAIWLCLDRQNALCCHEHRSTPVLSKTGRHGVSQHALLRYEHLPA